MKKYKKANTGYQMGPDPYDPNQFYNYNYGNYPKPYTGTQGELPGVTVKPSRRNFGQPEITPIRDMSYETPSELERESPSYQVQNRKPMEGQGGGNHSFALADVITPTLGLINALLPEQNQDTRRPFEPIAYNPYAYGTGSQAIYENGGSLQKGSWNSNYFMRDGGKFKKVQPQPLGAQAYSPYGDTTGQPIRNLKREESKVKLATSVKPTSIKKETKSGYADIVPNAPSNSLERLDSAYNANWEKYDNFRATDTANYTGNESFIPLTSGKFNTGKAPERMVADLVKAAKNNGVDPYIMLGLAGQESTFGFSGRQGNSENVISGWDVGSQYRPNHYSQFLADKNVPGITTKKSNHGYSYDYDPNQLNSYLDQNPELMNQYFDKLNSMQRPETFSYFDEAAKQIKNKGIQSYNPGDPRYANMVNQSAEMLRKDPKLSKYVSNLEDGGTIAEDGHWIQKAVNPKHKGYCTPMTKSTCTPRRKALAKTFKKHHGFHKAACGKTMKYEEGGTYDLSQEEINQLLDNGYELKF